MSFVLLSIQCEWYQILQSSHAIARQCSQVTGCSQNQHGKVFAGLLRVPSGVLQVPFLGPGLSSMSPERIMESMSSLNGEFPMKFGLMGLQVFLFLRYGEKQFINVGVEAGREWLTKRNVFKCLCGSSLLLMFLIIKVKNTIVSEVFTMAAILDCCFLVAAR
ncbi:hypothetical protein DPMN_070704 [Dreissena polymorpha]|uniref:Uncharacterized protein n=1 Tax=Dreissena polymorpha TaxID=45954 RepID=A0A9D3Z3I2_DREPO|nr:hypothetical protein DPMN_070704 [Dreissena polymorpha]